jgi:hypothetical protein
MAYRLVQKSATRLKSKFDVVNDATGGVVGSVTVGGPEDCRALLRAWSGPREVIGEKTPPQSATKPQNGEQGVQAMMRVLKRTPMSAAATRRAVLRSC